jgi:hypothetical protein
MAFEYTIAVLPNGTNLTNEIKYIKSALLYADKITLISPLAYLFHQLTTDSSKVAEEAVLQSLFNMLEFIEQADSAMCEQYYPELQKISQAVHDPRYKQLSYAKKLQFKLAVTTAANQIDQTIFNALGTEQCGELEALFKSGKVQTMPFETPMSSVVAHSAEYLVNMMKSMKTSYPLFDETSSKAIGDAFGSKIIKLSEPQRRMATHAGFMDNQIQRLPSFELATVDEILDIRKELDRQIQPFRKRMLEYSATIQSMPWDSDFAPECQLLFDGQIAPAIHEIDEAVRENRIGRNIARKFTTEQQVWSTAGLCISVAASGIIPAFTEVLSNCIPGLIGTAVFSMPKLVEAFYAYQDKKKDVKKQELYFYYQAGNELQRRPTI